MPLADGLDLLPGRVGLVAHELHERLVAQVVPCDGRLRGEPVVRAHDGDERDVQKRPRRQVAHGYLLGQRVADEQVDLPAFQQVERVVGGALEHGGHLVALAGDHRGEGGEGGYVGILHVPGDAHGAFGLEGVDDLPRVVVGVDDDAGVLEQHAPRLGELHAFAAAVEQVGAELALERQHVLAQRGLRDVEAARGLGEVEALRQLDELPAVVDVHENPHPLRAFYHPCESSARGSFCDARTA